MSIVSYNSITGPPLHSVADSLREHRERLDLTQQQLADLVRVSRQSVIKWEAGESVPSEDNFRRLAEVFHVTPVDLRYPSAPGRQGADERPEYGKPADRRLLDPAVYERIYGYLARMENAGCTPEQIDEAHRILTVFAWSKLHADPHAETKAIDDQLADVDAGWNAIRESIGRQGVKL